MSDPRDHAVVEASPFAHIDHPEKFAFLECFRDNCNVRKSCDLVGIGRASVYRWRDQDPEFAEAFELAREDATDALEAEAWRRAVEGVERDTGWYKGEPGGTVREYSDRLMELLLKAHKPDKYADRLNVRSLVGKIDFGQLPAPILARIANGENLHAVVATYIEEHRRLPPGIDGRTVAALQAEAVDDEDDEDDDGGLEL